MKRKLISASLLPFLALTTAVAYTVKENIDLETTLGSNAEPNSNENTFYAEEPSTITFAEIKELFENESVYDYDGTPKKPKLKEGKVLPHDIEIAYRQGDWPVNAGNEMKAIIVYRVDSLGSKKQIGVMTDKRIIINQLPFPVTLPNKIVIGIGADGFVYNVIGDIPQEILDDGEIEYAINGNPAIDNIPKITDYGQYEVAGQHWGSVNYMPFDATSTVSVIHKLGNIEVDYDGNDNYNKIPQADLSNVPGVSIDKITVKNSQGTIVTEMIKAGVYTVEITYAYIDAESVTDTLTYTIKKEVYEAKAQISEVEYNGSEQTLGVDFSQLPAGVKIKAGSPVEVKGKNIGTYTATIQMDGGDAYEDFEVKVTLAVKQAIIPSITLKNKEVFYNGNTHAVVIEEVLPEEVKVTYSYLKDGTPIQGEPTEAGVYTVVPTIVTGDNYTYTGVAPSATLTIKKGNITGVTLPKLPEDQSVYNEQPKSLVVEGTIPEAVKDKLKYTYTDKDGKELSGAPTEAGLYKVTVTLEDKNYNLEPITQDLEITKATLTIAPVSKSAVYSGQSQNIEFTEALPSGVVVEKYESNTGIDVGKYQGKAIINGGNNYNDTTVELTLDITPFEIKGLTLPSSPVVYDGQPKSVIAEGPVPAEVDLKYTYTDKDGNPIQGAPTDAGIYNVTVTVEDKNYNLEPISTTFEITKATLTIAPVSKSAVYSGQSQNIEITETLPAGVVVEKYESNTGVDVGKYEGKAIINGGNNYNDTTVELTLDITPFEIKGLTLPSSPVVYDGQPKSVIAEGPVPAEVDLKYTYTDKDGKELSGAPTDAGIYNVTVTVEDKNYVLVPISTTFEITKATLTIAPVSKSAVYSGQSQNIEITEALPSGVVVEKYESNTGVDVGKYEGKAIINGGNNYNDTTVELTLDITPFEIKGLTLPSSPVVYDGKPKSVIAEGPVPAGVDLKYTYTDKDGKELSGAPTDAGIYNVTVTVEDKNYNLEPITQDLEITKATLTIGSVSKSAVYSGQSQNIEITETLPSGVVVEKYESNTGVDVGKYEGKAIINGGNNYNDTTVELTLDITPFEIKGLTLPSSPVVYDGQPKSVIAEGPVPAEVDLKYTYKDKDGNPIQGAPTDAGIYNVTVTVEDKNYVLVPVTAKLTIDKAAITGISFADKTVTYDGTAQLLEVTGILPTGVTVAYTDNSKTEAGQYDAVAVLTGGNNYVDQTLNAKLTIDKAVITGVSFADKTVTYDGTAQLLEVTGTLPTGVTVAYTDNSKTEAGQYDAVAVLTGGNNYVDQTLNAKLTIDKAVITGVSFADKTVTYDGTAQLLEVTGILPTGVTVAYTDNSKTEAGQYDAVAVLTGGNNYVDQTLNAKLTIDKAVITGVAFADKTVTYDGTAQLLEVTGTLPTGVTVAYTDNSKTEAGQYNAVAVLTGGNNYIDQTLNAKLTIDKAAITGVAFADKTVTYNGNPQEVKVEGVPTDLVVEYTYKDKEGKTLTGAPTEAGDYTVEAIVKGGANYEDKKFEAKVTISKAVIPNGTLEGKTVTYNGNPQEVKVEGIPTDLVVEYTYRDKDGNPLQGKPTEAGDYTVEAIVKGGANYEDKKFEAKVTISKAVIPNGTLEGKTVTYNGNPQEVKVEGVPTDLVVEYTYKEKDGKTLTGAPTDAGEYTVEVIVKGGTNYEDKKFEAKVTISKAVISNGTLEGKTVTYDGTPQGVTVEGVPSDFEVTYVYSKDGNPIQGKPTEAGDYTVEAIVKGGANYEDKKFEAKVTISKAVIPNGTLEGKTVTYNGNPQEVKVEGVPTDLVVEYTYKEKDGKTLTGAPTDAGEYTVEAIVKGGTNYEDKKFEAKVTISKAAISGVTFKGKETTYNGNPQEVKVEGIPTDLVVEYTYRDKDGNPLQGAPTEAGDYTVEAIVKGGANYEDKKFEAKVTISKAVIPNGTLEGKTVTYNGHPQEVKVEGVPTDLVVEYTYKDKDGKTLTGAPTEAGDYTVEAIVKGGTNYEDKKFETTVTIAKAAISGVTFKGKETTYNGLTQRIEIVGELPKEASVSYETNEGVNAGEYLAKAIIKGGKNYEDLVLTTTLKINKANITGVSFIDKVVAYNKAEQIIEITGALPTGVTVVYEKAKQTEVGIYEAVARIIGGTNYNDLRLTARFEIKEDRTPSKDAEIFELVINGVVYKKPGQVIEHMLKPTPYEDITDVDIVSFTDYSSLNVPEAFTVDTRDPKVYYKDITVTSEDGKTSKTYTLKLIKPIEDRLIILQKFQNTLLINNNPSTNGGYAFVSYQWFRNGVVVSTKQSYSVGQAGVDKLNPNDYYYLIVKTTTGEEIYSTRIDIYEEQSKEIKLYPNPVSSSDMTTNIMVDYSAAQFEKGRVEILTPDGRFIYRQELTIGENRVVIPTQLSAGIYLAVVDINGKKQTIRFSVK